eukprot:3423639-Pyramimonas_sp.AAC.1
MKVSMLDHICLGSGNLSIGTCPATKPYTDCALVDNWGCGRGSVFRTPPIDYVAFGPVASGLASRSVHFPWIVYSVNTRVGGVRNTPPEALMHAIDMLKPLDGLRMSRWVRSWTMHFGNDKYGGNW